MKKHSKRRRESSAPIPVVVVMPAEAPLVPDLSKIDFEALRRRFKESREKNANLEKLKDSIRA